MKIVDILKTARELLSDPKRWTKGSFARMEGKKGETGATVPALSDKAVCWCAEGAIQKAYVMCLGKSESYAEHWNVATRAAGWLEKQVPKELQPVYRNEGILSIPGHNDSPNTTHEELMAWFDRTIKAVGEE